MQNDQAIKKISFDKKFNTLNLLMIFGSSVRLGNCIWSPEGRICIVPEKTSGEFSKIFFCHPKWRAGYCLVEILRSLRSE
jgi:hypothetical protein